MKNVRDKGDVMDLDDHSLPRRFFPLSVGRCRCFVISGEKKRIGTVFHWRGCLLHRFPRINGIFVVLKVAVGVVTVILCVLILVDGFGKILQL